jgi:hypothetical protein
MKLKVILIVDLILSANLLQELKIHRKCINLMSLKSCRKFIEMDQFLLAGTLLLMLLHIMEEYLLKNQRLMSHNQLIIYKKVLKLIFLTSNQLMLQF